MTSHRTLEPATTPHTDPLPTVVLGGTGKTGRRVLAQLRALGVPTRCGSRAGTPPFSWQDQQSWAPLLTGAGAAYIAYAPDLAAPGGAETVSALALLADTLGLRRLVLLSGRGEPAAQAAEHELRTAAGSAAVTVVRASWFAQNFSEDFLRDAVSSGELALPVGSVVEPFVDAADIAAVAVAALTAPGHAGRTYEVTGPRLLTFAQVAGIIAAATGRPLGFRSVPLDTYLDQLSWAGMPSEVVQLMGYLFSETLDGRNARLGDGVPRALGRPARDLEQWAQATAQDGSWSTRLLAARP